MLQAWCERTGGGGALALLPLPHSHTCPWSTLARGPQDAAEAWVAAQTHARVLQSQPGFFHARFVSFLWGFADDFYASFRWALPVFLLGQAAQRGCSCVVEPCQQSCPVRPFRRPSCSCCLCRKHCSACPCAQPQVPQRDARDCRGAGGAADREE